MLSFQNNKPSWVAVARMDTSNITIRLQPPNLKEVSAVLTLCHLPIPYFLGVFNGFFKMIRDSDVSTIHSCTSSLGSIKIDQILTSGTVRRKVVPPQLFKNGFLCLMSVKHIDMHQFSPTMQRTFKIGQYPATGTNVTDVYWLSFTH